MVRHSSATRREPHTLNNTINNALRRRAESVKAVDNLADLQISDDDSSNKKIETLTEMICGAGEESAAALLILMAAIESSAQPQALVNTAKHLAFTHCGELNVYGMVEAQVSALQAQLLGR